MVSLDSLEGMDGDLDENNQRGRRPSLLVDITRWSKSPRGGRVDSDKEEKEKEKEKEREKEKKEKEKEKVKDLPKERKDTKEKRDRKNTGSTRKRTPPAGFLSDSAGGSDEGLGSALNTIKMGLSKTMKTVRNRRKKKKSSIQGAVMPPLFTELLKKSAHPSAP